MNPEESRELLAKVQANRARLDGCARHRFEIGDPPYRFGQKFECVNCGGEMDAVQAFRYCQGYKAAGGNPNDVIPGYE